MNGPIRLALPCALGLLSAALLACDGGTDRAEARHEPPGADLPVRRGLSGRLTPTQHQNVVSDVLGVELSALDLAAAGANIPQEQPSTGLFRNGADGQAASDDYPLAFGRLAALVAEAVDIESLIARLAPCADAATACDRLFVSEVGERLFRRPLSARELDAFVALHASVMGEGLSFEAACRSVLEAMLQAPAFSFRLERELGGELGEKRYLDGFELASRLSFFLWDSAPDDELLSLAQSGSLDGSAAALPALRGQIGRMLSDVRARRLTREWLRDFAGTERAAFVGVTPELRASLLDSMLALVDAQLWDQGGQIRDLFTMRQGYAASEPPERVGWLTHPAFIAGMGDAQVGKVVHRGITLMVKLMCRQPIQLPDGLEATVADFNQTYADLTERQRSEERSHSPSCWACHSQFEPLAYGFDRFDAAGNYRGEVDEQGRALPIDGWMTDDLSLEESARPRYADVAELMTLMADSDVIQACMAEHFLAFATGRASSEDEKAFATPVYVAQARAGGTLSAMVESVATSELFRALESSGPAPEAP